tara:strand:- start:455 stop:730 length:276 start_codon:yes stop_codon:yes gene_type:complete
MGFWKTLTGLFSTTEAPKVIAKKKVKSKNVLDKAMKEAEVELDKFEPKRARTKKGRYVKDNKSTSNINEAWVGGKAPKKRAKKKVVKIKKK